MTINTPNKFVYDSTYLGLLMVKFKLKTYLNCKCFNS